MFFAVGWEFILSGGYSVLVQKSLQCFDAAGFI